MTIESPRKQKKYGYFSKTGQLESHKIDFIDYYTCDLNTSFFDLFAPSKQENWTKYCLRLPIISKLPVAL